MKQLFIIFTTVIFSVSVGACKKSSKATPEEKEAVAPGAVTKLNAYSGKERIKLSWQQPRSSEDPVVKYRVFWSNQADSLEIPAPHTDSAGIMVPGLAEGKYTFFVYAYNQKGLKSQGLAISGKAYGSQYESGLLNRPVKQVIFDKNDNTGVIQWGPAGAGAQASDLSYTDMQGNARMMRVLPTEESTILPAYKTGAAFAYRTLFLPEISAIDTFYAAYDTVTIADIPGEEDNYTSMVVLEADGPGNTYELLGSVLGGSPEETPDCGHTSFGRHITEEFNSELNKNVFAFFAHTDFDDDRCGATDRQRTEIKTYSPSPASIKAFSGDAMIFKWKFKLDAGFQPSSGFTHIHQIKAGDGTNAGSPLITITPRYGNPDKLEIIHTGDNSASSLGKVKIVELAPFKGSWIEAVEKITFGTHGTYLLELKRVSDGKVLLSYSKDDIDLWRSGATFIRPKWGIYRSLNNKERLRDEKVLFADFAIGKK